jgi:acetate kinase
MRILVLNAGSSSLKFKLVEMPSERVPAAGSLERIGEAQGRLNLSGETATVDCPDHTTALALACRSLTEGSGTALPDLSRIDAVGHRVVHGKDRFTRPTLVDAESLTAMESWAELAPLHMPPAISCIKACRDLLPAVPQVAHFDTAFHAGMPDHAAFYPVPAAWRTRFGLRRYGFHGASHEYVTRAAAAMLGRSADRLRLITCHLGNGASLAAWDRGRVADTTMGFTPLEGLMMGTRPGEIDPAVVPYLAEKLGVNAQAVVAKLNRECGLAGVSEAGRDLRAVEAARAAGSAKAQLAWRMFVHRFKKHLGAHFFVLGGVDGVVFTGGIGEHAANLRADCLAGLAALGLAIDPEANQRTVGGQSGFIQQGDAIPLMVIPCDEEMTIARATYRLLSR